MTGIFIFNLPSDIGNRHLMNQSCLKNLEFDGSFIKCDYRLLSNLLTIVLFLEKILKINKVILKRFQNLYQTFHAHVAKVKNLQMSRKSAIH